MDKPILGLDHVIVGVADLTGARGDWERLGFTCTPLGNHVGKVSANHCIMFPDTYLELVGINEPWNEDWGLTDLLKRRGEGLLKLALGTADADAGRAALAAAGMHPGEPHDLARPQRPPAPEGMVRFRNVSVPETDTAGLPLFLCCHETPALMRTPAWLAHPNGARSFAAITAVVQDPAAVCHAFRRIFEGRCTTRTLYGGVVDTGRGLVHLTTPADFCRLHPGAAPPDLPLPFWCGLQVGVASLDATLACLGARGVPCAQSEAVIRVAPADARGVLLEFVTGA